MLGDRFDEFRAEFDNSTAHYSSSTMMAVLEM